uniref:SAM domain-containing protein n=1 Tax=Rodentolepis nana TaxID=102285 RepID=A0A0R3TFH6_RODNA
LTHIRQWFLEDIRVPNSDESDIKESSDQVQDAEITWQQADVTVARWLANQLDYTQLAEALHGLQDLSLNPSTSIWSLSETETKGAQMTTPETSNSRFLSRLESITKEQITNHIRRLLKQYPECIDKT